jgi:hypothetical protein
MTAAGVDLPQQGIVRDLAGDGHGSWTDAFAKGRLTTDRLPVRSLAQCDDRILRPTKILPRR